jgi:hypothetical protein
MTPRDVQTQDLLNAQTGKIEWRDLIRHFARGVVVCVQQGQDLVGIADFLVKNQSDEISSFYEKGILHLAADEDAMRWEKNKTQFWAVVVAPWVVVQEK